MRVWVGCSACVVFHFKIYHIMAFKGFMNKTHFSIKFFQKKKKKKKKALTPSGGFQKSKFFFKNTTTPTRLMKNRHTQMFIRRSMGGGDFLKNPEGLNLLFCKPGTYLCYLFFYFLFFDSENTFPMEVGFFSFGVGVVLQGFQILGLDEKTK